MPKTLPVPDHIFRRVMADYRAGRIIAGAIFPEINRRCIAYYAALPRQTVDELVTDSLEMHPIPGEGWRR